MEDVYLLNPRRRKRSHRRKRYHHKRRGRRNAGELAILNPRRRRRHHRSYSRHRRHYRRNPSLPLIGSIDVMTIAAAGAGALGGRYLGKQVLDKIGQPDSGIIGALATFGTGLIASFVVRKFLRQPKLANGILMGAGAMALARAGDEMIFQGKGLSGFFGLGTYLPDYVADGGAQTNFLQPGSRFETRFNSRFS